VCIEKDCSTADLNFGSVSQSMSCSQGLTILHAARSSNHPDFAPHKIFNDLNGGALDRSTRLS